MNKKIRLSIIVPCFNEGKSIDLFYKGVKRHINDLDVNYELIFINDGSRDDTKERVELLHEQDPKVALIDFSRNFGKEAAMLAGLHFSKGEYVVIMDADLQHPPQLLKEMVDTLNLEPYDAVAAIRRNNKTKGKGDPLLRRIFSKNFYLFVNKMSDVDLKEGATDYRMMKRKVVNSLLAIKEYNRFSKGLFEWVGFKTKYIEYRDVERVAGKSSWSYFSLINYAIEGITSFSTVPLKFASLIGVLSAFVSFLYLAFVITDKVINGNDVSGWATIVSLILFLGGITLISLGVLGEYIGRIYNEVKRRPNYIINEHLTSNVNHEE
ncbi:glycosyltransferase family 2 protein [Haloplasma contractile]|uniref:Glycosil transferase protein n=1 Tax=Haloplasma contractile SSD-17B TaxID=1033810 RepID=U2FLH5_9MOLU|nr:glycosyltransferase family 2 protein [Haloplasma contractile]ERJ12024.1 Glycosil transferase protein [Haloplasma contractile SSD-17B]